MPGALAAEPDRKPVARDQQGRQDNFAHRNRKLAAPSPVKLATPARRIFTHPPRLPSCLSPSLLSNLFRLAILCPLQPLHQLLPHLLIRHPVDQLLEEGIFQIVFHQPGDDRVPDLPRG